jgi:protein phosphatase
MADPTDLSDTLDLQPEDDSGDLRLRADIAALSHRGKVRQNNEDAFIVFRIGRFLEPVASSIPIGELPPQQEVSGHVMIVADGLGGHEGGEVASRSALLEAVRLIGNSRRWALRFDDPATRVREIRELMERARGYLAEVHAALQRQAEADPALAGMGTTLTGAYTAGRDLFVLHVGDSKAFLVRGGMMIQVTRDHTVAQRYADLGMIPQHEVPTHQMSHVLTRAVGGPDADLRGDMHHLSLRPGDRLMLCSDGLTDMADEEQIAATLNAHPTSEGACRALVDLALERGGRDNITVVVAGYVAA